MAFISSFGEDDFSIQAEILERGEELISRICIGHDDDTGAVYSIVVALPVDHRRPNCREIHFDVVEYIPDEDGQNLVYWHNDGLHTNRILEGRHRETALFCICSLVHALLSHAKPEVAYMMTVTPNLPTKALTKYETICAAARDAGYEARRDAPFHGTQIWLMSRIADGTDADGTPLL